MCSLPTAPFAEQHVARWVEEFVRRRPRLKLSRDPAGNLLVELRGPKPRLPRWVFVAHMDHPGMIARRMLDRRTLLAEFRGGVQAAFLDRTPVRFLDGQAWVGGVVVHAQAHPRTGRAREVRVRVARPLPRGAIGMYDLPAAAIRGSMLDGRACDDLAGTAACLAMLDALYRRPPASTVAALLTRAEEVGFVGAIAAVKARRLLGRSDRIISVETSAQQPVARQGRGPIVRVGDKSSVFHSGLTAFLTQRAAALARRDKRFSYQRALMPGGTCEAAVFDAYGHMASALCVALVHYHNMNVSRRRIAAERIDVNDWRNMVRLFVDVARHGHEFAGGVDSLKRRVERTYARWRPLLKQSPI